MTLPNHEVSSAEIARKSSSPIIVVVFVLLIGFLVFLWSGLRKSYEGPVRVGEDFIGFTLQTFDGQTIRTEEQTGKVLLINFWASWCKPCESEADILQQAWQYYEPDGQVLFLGVDYVDTETEALASMAKYNITYPNGPDLRSEISKQYRITGVPETFIVDKAGKLVHIQIGPFNSLDEIKSYIDPYLE